MIQHHTPDGRRVYTLSEAAVLHHGDDERAVRQWIEKTRRRLNRQRTPKAGEINAREPVYYPEDLGIERTTMKTWTLSTDISVDSMQTACDEIGIQRLSSSDTGWYQGVSVSMVADHDGPPTELERLRQHLIARGDKARWY